MLLPLHLLATTLLGLLSLGLLATGGYCLYRAAREFKRRPVIILEKTRHRQPTGNVRQVPQPAALKRPVLHDKAVMMPLIFGILLPLFSFGGRRVIQYAFPLGQDEPRATRAGTAQHVRGAGGESLRIESYGNSNGPVLLFTHGWSMDSTEWFYAKRDLSREFHLIFWDLPGLGESSQPQDRDFTLERMAHDLRAVLATAEDKPVILVGHSIGGMVNLTFCRLFPELLRRQVKGLIQVDTSYTNPVKTTKNSALSQSLQKPVGEPILYGMIWLSPLVQIMNWLSYENGTSYVMNAKSSFAGSETRGQVDMVSRLQTEASPAVVARGTLAMFHWDATAVLPGINVPVLLLVGEEDTTTLPSASEYMNKQIPGSKLVKVGTAAHYSLLEQNRTINSEINHFVTSQYK